MRQRLVGCDEDTVFERGLAAKRLEITLRRVQRGLDVAHVPADEVLGRPLRASHRDVGLALREAQ
jgi:hypothetical protein